MGLFYVSRNIFHNLVSLVIVYYFLSIDILVGLKYSKEQCNVSLKQE